MASSSLRGGNIPMDIAAVTRSFSDGQVDPESFLQDIATTVASDRYPGVWIYRCTSNELNAQLSAVLKRKQSGQSLPLFGVPFAVKDNIDVAGIPTTAGCPAFSYLPTKSATAVQRLCDAGAIVIGKTNLDQFAAGLVGTRSPYGVCRNPFNPQYISGGSSSGSAVAVATGMVSFALGTDTAGSGRVPAAFNNIIGLKPTRGLVSAAGVVPACQSLDCVSVFSLNCGDAQTVLDIIEGYDPADPYTRRRHDLPPTAPAKSAAVRFGIPRKDQLCFFGDDEAESLYHASIRSLTALGGTAVEIDYTPFSQAASMLYTGPWVAERYLVVKELLDRDPALLLPVTRSILEAGRSISAADGFAAMHQLEALRQNAREVLAKVDLLILPTTGTIYTVDQIEADPVKLNTNLGYYTNFLNLFDLCAVAVPSGFKHNGGVPLGVSLVGAAGTESLLLTIGDALHRAAGTGMGIMKDSEIAGTPKMATAANSGASRVKVAVVGAHLSGMALNHQMTERNATLLNKTRTAPVYRFYALPNTKPAKPGLVRVLPGEVGHSIELEVWDMPIEVYGSFVAGIGSPLGIGMIQLEDGSSVQGFLCESYAVIEAKDISSFGGWRAYVASQSTQA